MVKGILADVNIEGHVERLCQLMRQEYRQEFWEDLQLKVPTFAEIGLNPGDPDVLVWQKCQEEELVLITANRNQTSTDSLDMTIRALGTATSLPVLTIGDPERVLRSRDYAERVADKLLQYVFDIDVHRGAGRLYLP